MQNDDPQEKPKTSQELSWTASEFIEHKKNATWYAILLAIKVRQPILNHKRSVPIRKLRSLVA